MFTPQHLSDVWLCDFVLLKIINMRAGGVWSSLKLSSLVDRRNALCKVFLENSVLDGKRCLHYL